MLYTPALRTFGVLSMGSGTVNLGMYVMFKTVNFLCYDCASAFTFILSNSVLFATGIIAFLIAAQLTGLEDRIKR